MTSRELQTNPEATDLHCPLCESPPRLSARTQHRTGATYLYETANAAEYSPTHPAYSSLQGSTPPTTRYFDVGIAYQKFVARDAEGNKAIRFLYRKEEFYDEPASFQR